MSKDGYARQRDIPATVTVGANPNVQIVTGATTKAYLDVFTAGGTYGTPLSASVQIHNAAHAVQQSATTDDSGVAHLEVPGGAAFHVNAQKQYYITQESAADHPGRGPRVPRWTSSSR